MALDGIQYRTTDALRWGDGKAGVLTAAEVDSNFWELYSRLKSLEDNPPTPNNISNIQVVGSQLTIFLDSGESFGPFTLPMATFEFKGDYVDGATYYELDIVSDPMTGLYLVRLGFTASGPFDPALTDGDGNAIYLKLFGVDYYTYTIGFFFPNVLGKGFAEGSIMMGHMVVNEITFAENMPGSYAKFNTPPTDDMSINVSQNGVVVGSIEWAGGDEYATFVFSEFFIEPGDVLTFDTPAPGDIDPDARDLFVTLVGKRTPEDA